MDCLQVQVHVGQHEIARFEHTVCLVDGDYPGRCHMAPERPCLLGIGCGPGVGRTRNGQGAFRLPQVAQRPCQLLV